MSGPRVIFRPGEILGAAKMNRLSQEVEANRNRNPQQSYERDTIAGRWNGRDGFWAEITGYATLSTNRWKYAWAEVVWNDSTGAWVTGGMTRSGTTTTGYAINAVESSNNGTGIEGNSSDLTGITLTDSAGHTTSVTYTLNPVQGDPVVWMRAVRTTDGASGVALRYVFQYENWTAIDGGGVGT